MKLLNALLLAQSVGLIQALTPAEWRNQSIYFVMTDRFARDDGSTTAACNTSVLQYCGGTWQGIINHLDYIQNMGFTALWITPVTHQIEEAPAYHGYWQNDLYDINEHYGTKDDLKSLSTALHDRGMYLMIDVVANHFAAAGISNASEVDYSKYIPFNDAKYFHPPMAIDDYDNQTQVETGWLVVDPDPVALPDVNTTRQDVRDLYYSWVKDLVANYSADGLRVDTVKHVEKDFWSGFNKAAGVYNVGEVLIDNVTYLCDYQNYMDGLLNYGVWYSLIDAFRNSSGSMTALANAMNAVKSTCKDDSLLGSFMENHDNPRFPSLTPDITLAANGISFTMLADGIPIIYQGQEQHYAGGQDPANREALWLSGYNTDAQLYKLITSLNKIRLNAVEADGDNYLTYKNWPIYTDANTIAVRKGFDDLAILGVYSNQGSEGGQYTLTIPGDNTGYTPGSCLTEVLSCTQVTVGQDGSVPVSMNKGEPKIFYPTNKLTELCQN